MKKILFLPIMLFAVALTASASPTPKPYFKKQTAPDEKKIFVKNNTAQFNDVYISAPAYDGFPVAVVGPYSSDTVDVTIPDGTYNLSCPGYLSETPYVIDVSDSYCHHLQWDYSEGSMYINNLDLDTEFYEIDFNEE